MERAFVRNEIAAQVECTAERKALATELVLGALFALPAE
jgi:hypothetical protein